MGGVTAARHGHWIGGESVQGAAEFEAVNPTTGAVWGRFPTGSDAEVDAAVRAAEAAFAHPSWAGLTATRRGRLIMDWAALVAAEGPRLARIETELNGKLLSEMTAQFRVIPDWMTYAAGMADKIEGRVIPVNVPGVLNYTRREPWGVVAVITPWNSPTFLTLQAVAPALAAGNTVVIKPSEVTPAAIIEVARLAGQAGIPPGVVNVVTGMRTTGEALVDHPGVRKIVFTGGVAAGREVAARAGRRLVPATLELGGKSPQIVFADANLEAAEAGLLAGIFAAAGQSCAAGSRAFIEAPVYDRLVARLVERTRAIRLGDPTEAGTQMGPVASRAQLEKDCGMVERALGEGAELLTGGRRAAVPGLPGGFFFEPAILGHVRPESELATAEVFGPVLNVAPFRDAEEAVRLATDTSYGLAAGIWTKDIHRAHRMAERIGAGTVWVNMYRAIGFNSPYGGYRDSGIGRLNGFDGITAFTQVKSVWVDLTDTPQDPFVIKL
ncbi:MAG: aldehyde dehydrogenase [Rhodobacteraceae bacterium]|jgi:aldehyde dehydrogenase (NAD+)|nr:aldehyde dehydrogenase [Paracoccaceae bacterium]